MRFAPLVVIALAGTAHAGGGSFEFTLGGGAVYIKPESGDKEVEAASSQPHIGVGWKFTRKLGVSARLGLIFPRTKHDYELYSLETQYFIVKRVFVAGSIGYAQNSLDTPLPDGTSAYGALLLGARVGGTILGESHRLTASIMALPMFYPHDFTVGFLVQAGYQYW